MSDDINRDRRRFFGSAAMTLAAAQLALSETAAAQAARPAKTGAAAVKPGTNTSFASMKQIDAGVLDIGYAEAGPADGPPVILLHGWPYDIYSFVDVAPLLAAAGHRVIMPHLRGYGTTRFLSDWGARTANIMAALWPERCKEMVSVSGYLIGSQQAGKMPLPPKAELQWWYQFYFATERGREGYDKYRREFSKLIWQLASPQWHFDDATFARSDKALDNPSAQGVCRRRDRRGRLPVTQKRLDIAYGSNELPALVLDSINFHEKRAAARAPGKLIPVAGADHFSILEALRRPEGRLVDATRALLD